MLWAVIRLQIASARATNSCLVSGRSAPGAEEASPSRVCPHADANAPSARKQASRGGRRFGMRCSSDRRERGGAVTLLWVDVGAPKDDAFVAEPVEDRRGRSARRCERAQRPRKRARSHPRRRRAGNEAASAPGSPVWSHEEARARSARRRHLPQALARQPLPRRRTHDRTLALGRPDLPAAAPLALRLPQRRPLTAKARGDPRSDSRLRTETVTRSSPCLPQQTTNRRPSRAESSKNGSIPAPQPPAPTEHIRKSRDLRGFCRAL